VENTRYAHVFHSRQWSNYNSVAFVLFVLGACGSVVIDSNSCMYTNDDSGHPFDRYVGKAKQISVVLPIINASLSINEA